MTEERWWVPLDPSVQGYFAVGERFQVATSHIDGIDYVVIKVEPRRMLVRRARDRASVMEALMRRLRRSGLAD